MPLGQARSRTARCSPVSESARSNETTPCGNPCSATRSRTYCDSWYYDFAASPEGTLSPRRIDAVLIESSNAQRLVEFYRDVIGLPLKAESHDGSELHWGCFIDDVH